MEQQWKIYEKDVRLINNEEDFLKHPSKPTYITHKIFSKDYAAIHEVEPVLILNKPIYIGFTGLDLINRRCFPLQFH